MLYHDTYQTMRRLHAYSSAMELLYQNKIRLEQSSVSAMS